jgi:hypothetical protein
MSSSDCKPAKPLVDVVYVALPAIEDSDLVMRVSDLPNGDVDEYAAMVCKDVWDYDDDPYWSTFKAGPVWTQGDRPYDPIARGERIVRVIPTK